MATGFPSSLDTLANPSCKVARTFESFFVIIGEAEAAIFNLLSACFASSSKKLD